MFSGLAGLFANPLAVPQEANVEHAPTGGGLAEDWRRCWGDFLTLYFSLSEDMIEDCPALMENPLMNNRSLYTPLLASVAAVIFFSHAQPHIEQPIDVSFVAQYESPAASGSVAASTASTAQMLNSYVNK